MSKASRIGSLIEIEENSSFFFLFKDVPRDGGFFFLAVREICLKEFGRTSSGINERSDYSSFLSNEEREREERIEEGKERRRTKEK